jgi:hypothetical protein
MNSICQEHILKLKQSVQSDIDNSPDFETLNKTLQLNLALKLSVPVVGLATFGQRSLFEKLKPRLISATGFESFLLNKKTETNVLKPFALWTSKKVLSC